MSAQQNTMANSKDLAQEIIEKSLSTGASQAHVSINESELFEINFERDEISLVRTTYNTSTNMALFDQGKKGSSSFNGTSDLYLDQAINDAHGAMQASIADEANMVSSATSLPSSDFGDHRADKDQMGQAVKQFMSFMKKNYPDIIIDNCVYSFSRDTTTFFNSNNVFQQESRGVYQLSCGLTGKTKSSTTSFNYAGGASYTSFDSLESHDHVQTVINRVLRSFHPKKLPEKFVGSLIFTPESISTLAGSLSGALSGYELMTGTTPYKDQLGEIVAESSFSLLNRPQNHAFPHGSFFDGFGVPSQDRDIIVNGKLNDFLIDFFCSQKLKREQTAGVTNLVIPPGQQLLDDIIKQTKRGILMPRFSGGRPNSNLDFSGVAKSSFYIEDGEIKYPLIETMVNGNFCDLIKNITAISQEVLNSGSSSYPYLRAEGVTFSSD